MSLHKYSLWFMPTGRAGKEFSQLITQLAKEYSSPSFPPHITLVGLIEAEEDEMVRKTQAIAAQLHPFTVKLAQISYTDAFYKSLFVEVEPSTELSTAYQTATNIFPTSPGTSYAPHISLLYGTFPVETKQQIIKEIGDKLADKFEAKALYLYLTDGDATTWRKIKEFYL